MRACRSRPQTPGSVSVGSGLGAKIDLAETGQVRELFPSQVVRVESIPEVSDNGDPIDTLGWKVVYVNKQTKDANERTAVGDMVGGKLHAPNGLHVFDRVVDEASVVRACGALRDLFRILEQGPSNQVVKRMDPRFQMRRFIPRSPNNVLFIKDAGERQPELLDVLSSIKEYNPMLHGFVITHLRFCLSVMDSSMDVDDDLRGVQIQFIHYRPRGGIQAHIDSVQAFGESIGPIFTVNMNVGLKAFDLLPTLLPQETPSVRLVTRLGQITMMDAESRLLWSHSVPYGNGCDCYTIAYKFPCLDRYKDDTSGGYSGILGTPIPQNLAPMYRVSLRGNLRIVP